MLRPAQLFAFVLIAAAACGCASTAPRYSTNYGSVATLKAADLVPAKVGDVTKQTGAKTNVDSLTIRGGQYSSPYGSFTAFLREALKDELDHAELLNEHSTTQIDGVLIRNELDASGFSIGFVEMEAKITIKRDGAIVYDRTKAIRHEWPSSMIGAVAIPRAIENYPFAVRKLLAELYADPDFLAALKKR